ncbi:uncharacterized protein LOC110731802 [Chenopodium quinoa]|uniref:uncharacterized protein LOC110731802 n=1 Tax=Chenopodium quinoa TaxID=63459 RepID=UPI000B784B4A|nr:uncharacterized protein LOC110731802 [Chenopodium quinoa]
MKLPPGYLGKGFRFGAEFHGKDETQNGNRVCKLNKSLYGLKQAPRQWYAKLSSALINYGYRQSKTDHTLFTHQSTKGFVAILVYVDDLIVTRSNLELIVEEKKYLDTQFHMKDMGELRYFLGIEVDRTKRGIFLSQKKYVKDILNEYNLSDCKPLRLPMDCHVKLTHSTRIPLEHPEVYQRLVGKLIYLTITRPDIAFTVHNLSQFMHSPTSAHFQAAKRVLRYLSGSSDQGILLSSDKGAELKAYCDSDWGGCPITRRSTSGFCILLEAEYKSMALTICEVLWIKQLFKDLGIQVGEGIPIYCDNQAALSIAANPVQYERTKHIEIDCHFIREKVKDGSVRPTYVPGKDQIVDIFTKVLPVAQQQLLSKLGVQSLSSSLEGEY